MCQLWRWWWLLLHSAILRSRADSLRLHAILHEWLAFYSAFLNIHWSGVLTALAWLVPHETAAILAEVLCTPYNHALCHFIQSHILYATCYTVSIRWVCYSIYWAVDRTWIPKNYGTMSNNNAQHKKLSSSWCQIQKHHVMGFVTFVDKYSKIKFNQFGRLKLRRHNS